MMDPVADNEHPREQPAAPPSADPPAPPPAVRPPTEITPEQVRQFQEFQQFQELKRQQAEKGLPPGTPPPGALQPWGPPPPKESLPKRLLKATISKIVTGLVVLAILTLAAWFAIDYFLTPDLDQPPASETGGGKAETNLIYDTSPFETVRKIYHHIANGERGVPEQVCLRFTDRGKKFADDMGYDNCTDAVHGLAAQVTDADAYAESMPSYSTTTAPTEEAQISSCADSRGGIKGGPPLGRFTVEKIQGSKGGQWIITGHETESPCATVPTTPSN
jgi:hypothetical protein